MFSCDIDILNYYPEPGYKFIYIYLKDNQVLYVGQTKQPLHDRYRQHKRYGGNAGIEYINKLYAYEVMEEYVDFAEGYIGAQLNGIYQGCLPNYKKEKYLIPDDDTLDDLKRIVRYFSNKHNSWVKRVLTPGICVVLPDEFN